MNRIFTLVLLVFCALFCHGQTVVFSETFSNGWPANFVRVNRDGRNAATQLATLYGSNAWITRAIGPSDSVASSTSWTNPTGTADRWMITPPITINNANHVLRWRARIVDINNPDGYAVYVRAVTSPNDTNTAGFTNQVFTVAAENQSWTNRIVSLAGYNGQTVRIAFKNNSNDKYILDIDDINVLRLQPLQLKNVSSTMSNFVDFANPATVVKGVIQNVGMQTLTSVKLNYSINNGPVVSQVFTTNFGSFGVYNYNFSQFWTPTATGIYSVKVWASELNGQAMLSDTIERPISVLNTSELPDRLVLFEHFTQASCGPCAAQNPVFTSLLASNSSNATSIKYHTAWPGVDPMNAHNPTEVATRVAYYGVSGVPNVNLGSSNLGSPTTVTQNTINNEKAKKALFQFSMSANMDPTSRLLTISGAVEPKVAFSPNNANRLQVMLVEDPIVYLTPPGNNGETVFPTTFRKAFPNSEGTLIGANHLPGNAFSFNFNSFSVPGFYVDSNLYVIAFIQNHQTKEIHQAAKLKVGNFPTNVQEKSFANFRLYPNPASQWARVETQFESACNLEMSVYNALGQQVTPAERVKAEAGNFVYEVPMSALKPGIYTFRITSGEKVVNMRFQKI